LEDVTTGIYHAGRESRQYVDDPEYGVPFLRSSDILLSDLSHLSYLSQKQVERNSNLTIHEGWSLITRSGTIGRMAYTRKDMDSFSCSEDVLRVVPNNEKIKPGYLFAYLSSRIGIHLIVSGTYGAIIQHIEPEHITNLPVPRLGKIEDRAHELVQMAATLRVDAITQIKNATNQYLSAAGLQDITPYEWHQNSGMIGFTAKISRYLLRAVNYIPLNQEIVRDIKKSCPTWKPLGEITKTGTLRSGPRFKRIDCDPDLGVELIGQREISVLVPSGRWVARNKLPNDDLIFVPDGTIMVNAQGGLNESDSFARCQFITGKKLEYAYSQHFLRVIADEKKILRGALFAFFRSNIAFRLLRSCAIGSMQQDFHPDLIKEIPIPMISNISAIGIDSLVKNAYQKYDQAIDLEDEARTLVEYAIEEGGR
jgi:type I restriction enzyme S subunit